MKKSKKLVFEKTTVRTLSKTETQAVAGGMSNNVRCTQSGCASFACTDEIVMCP